MLFILCQLRPEISQRVFQGLDKLSRGQTKMSSRGVNIVLARGNRIKQKLQSTLEATLLEVEDVSYQHAGHAGVGGDANETHFNVKVVSSKFEGQSLLKRHRMVYDLLSDELQSGLHALSIVAKTPKEVGAL